MKTKRSMKCGFAAVGWLLLSLSASADSATEATNRTARAAVPETVRILCIPYLPFSTNLVAVSQEAASGQLPLSFVPFFDRRFCDAMVSRYESDPEGWTPEGRRLVALSYYSKRQMAKSLALLEDLHAEDPGNLQVLYPLAALVSLSGSNGVSRAREMFRQGLEAAPSAPFARQYLATLLAERDFAVDPSVFAALFARSIYDTKENDEHIAKFVLLYCAECPDDEFGKEVLAVHRRRFPQYWKTEAGSLAKTPEFAWTLWKIRKRYLEPEDESFRKMKVELVFGILPELEAMESAATP